MGTLGLCADSARPPGMNNHQPDTDGSHITYGYHSSEHQQSDAPPTSSRASLPSVTAYYTSDDAYPPPLNSTPSPLSSLHVISVLPSPSPYQFHNPQQAIPSLNVTFRPHGMDYTTRHQLPTGHPLVTLKPMIPPQQQDGLTDGHRQQHGSNGKPHGHPTIPLTEMKHSPGTTNNGNKHKPHPQQWTQHNWTPHPWTQHNWTQHTWTQHTWTQPQVISQPMTNLLSQLHRLIHDGKTQDSHRSIKWQPQARPIIHGTKHHLTKHHLDSYLALAEVACEWNVDPG